MQVLEGIFYTSLTEDLTQFIAEIKQKEVIDEYTIFIIFYGCSYYYSKYWKSSDCTINITNNYRSGVSFSNGKCRYLDNSYKHTIDGFKKMCIDYDLLESHIKFKYERHFVYVLKPGELYFHIYDLLSEVKNEKVLVIDFKDKRLTVNEFIEEILTNYPELYKYDYGQIKPAITKFN
jgi:hypothetical protein